QSARRAQERLSELLFEQARESFLDGDFLQAGRFLVEARNQGMAGPDARYLIGRVARVFDAELVSVDGHRGPVFAAQFSPDGKQAVTASHDGTAKIWDTATGKPLFVLAGHEKLLAMVRFSPDGTLVLTASFDGTAKLWSSSTGQLLHTLVGHKGE